MKKFFIAFIFLSIVGLIYFNSLPKEQIEKITPKSKQKYIIITNLELPKSENIIYKKSFALEYSEDHEQARWVAYQLLCSETKSIFKRKDNFREDKDIQTGSARDADYKKSGYDRGHLAPAADMAFDLISLEQSFLFSNISPQEPDFNRLVWKDLEEYFRDLACKYDTIYVATGPHLDIYGKGVIGENEVYVPEYYWKSVLIYTTKTKLSFGFFLPNKKIESSYWEYCISIDSLEKLINLDLYTNLPDSLESIIESKLDTAGLRG